MANSTDRRLKISIRIKILAVLSAVVVAAVAFYLFLASRIFYEDKTLLIYELNQTHVRTLGSEVDSSLRRVTDQLRLIAALSPNARPEKLPPELSTALEEGGQIVRLGWIRRDLDVDHNEPVSGVIATFPKVLKLIAPSIDGEAWLDQLRAKVPISLEKVLADGTWVRNATIAPEGGAGEEAPALMTVATRVGPGTALYADVRLDGVLQAFSNLGLARAYLTDSEGFTLADSEASRVSQGTRLSNDPLVKAAIASKVRSEVRTFEDEGREWLGSFFKLESAGLVVASRIDASEGFAAARILVRKSLIYALVVITSAFLVALFFSHSLTTPLERLLEATRRLAQGDFGALVPITTHDEIAVLSTSFNTMTKDLKRSRAELEEYSRTLEKKVADRTAAIKEAQEALIRTTRLASVGEIAGRAAHEVLNPLTNITTRLEKSRIRGATDGEDVKILGEIARAWQEAASQGPQKLMEALSQPSQAIAGKTLLEEDLSNLEGIARDLEARAKERDGDSEFLFRECGRISKIVNGMRSLTRVSGNRRKLELHPLLEEALGTMRDLLTKHGISVETRFMAGAPRIDADHDEMIQVLSNLLRNSMQAQVEWRRAGGAPEGGVSKIWIETEVRGERALIRVCDNGPGIPAESHARVFEPTFTTKSTEEGTGLGLSICRRFVRAYEGEISLEKSIPGQVTAFLIDLPEVPQNA